MTSQGYALARAELIHAITAYGGITTADGAVAGNTLIDAALIGSNDFLTNKTLLLMSGLAQYETVGISAFNSATGQIALVSGVSSQILRGTIFRVLNISEGSLIIWLILAELRKGLPSLSETWQDELGIDFTVWATTNPATGTAWNRGAVGGYLRATSVPAANEVARLVSAQRWIATPGVFGTNTVIRSFNREIELRLANIANMDNTLCLLGALTPNQADNRGSNNVIGWILQADVLASITDVGGVETVNTGFGETLTNWNKLRIEVEAATVRFYLNETLVATHIVNLPNLPMYLNHFIDTEAGGPGTIEVGVNRAWYGDRI